MQSSAAIDSTAHRIGDGFGLFRDLLEHEEVISALLCRGCVPINRERGGGHRFTIEIRDFNSVGREFDNLILSEFNRVSRVINESSNIGGQECLAVTDPNYKRRVTSSSHNAIGASGVNCYQSKRSA